MTEETKAKIVTALFVALGLGVMIAFSKWPEIMSLVFLSVTLIFFSVAGVYTLYLVVLKELIKRKKQP